MQVCVISKPEEMYVKSISPDTVQLNLPISNYLKALFETLSLFHAIAKVSNQRIQKDTVTTQPGW